MVVLFFGQPASGKTTIADFFVDTIQKEGNYFYDFVRIDGDKWRDVTKNVDYSKEGRLRNLKGAFDMALYLEKEDFIPILSFVTPYEDLRSYLKQNSGECVTIYLEYSEDRGRNTRFAIDFEEPIECDLKINTSEIGIKDCVNKVIETFKQKYFKDAK
jgi:adenylylsulfate kinase-like enzyme